MALDFQSLFAVNSGASGAGASGNNQVANAAKRLFFSYKPLLLNNGQEGAHDDVVDIPYVAVPFTLTKEQLTAAIAAVSIPGSIASARLVQIRNNQIRRSFNIEWTGAGQIQAPITPAPSVVTAAAGIAATPGLWYEVANTYVDAMGNTPLSTAVTVANSGQDLSQHFLTATVYEVDNPNFNLTTQNNTISLSESAVVTVVPYHTATDKHAGKLEVPLGGITERLTAAHSYNAPPVPYDDGLNSGSYCEYCWGIDVGGGMMFRTSTISGSGNKQFYGDNGWSGQNTDWGTDWENRGEVNLLMVGSDATKLVAAKTQFFWRPVGSSTWSTTVEFVNGHNYIAGYTRVNPDTFGQGDEFGETALFPLNGFTAAKYIWINHVSVSQPLGLTNKAGPAYVYAPDVGNNFHKVANASPTTISPSSWATGLPIGSRSSSYDPIYVTRVGGPMPIPSRMGSAPNSVPGVPRGDEFYQGPPIFNIAATVSPHGNATRADFYIRKVERQRNGTLIRSAWGKVVENNRTGPFTALIAEYPIDTVTAPTANTTNVYANSYLGKVSWGTEPDTSIQFQVGDAFRLQNVQHSFNQLGAPAKLDVSMEFTLDE